MNPSREVRFDGWTLRRDVGELVRDGRRIRLQGQPLRVLEALLDTPGELVTREALIARLWPRGVVDFDTALNTAVRRLRTALDDHADTPRYIETIPRRGYRLIAEVQPPDVPPVTSGPAPAPAGPDAGQVAAPSAARISRPRWPAAAVLALLGCVGLAGASWQGLDPAPAGPAAGGSTNAEAHDMYLRGQHLFQRRGPGDLGRARDNFEAAIGLEPAMAEAWVGLAGVAWIETVTGAVDSGIGLERLRRAAERALEIDPRLAGAHLRKANYLWATGDRAGQLEHFRRARELAPEDPFVLGIFSSLEARDGRLHEALDLQRRALRADPLSINNRYNLAELLVRMGRLEEAEAEMRKLLELAPAPGAMSDLLGHVLVLQGRFTEALAVAEDLTVKADRLEVQALALHGLGRRGEADSAFSDLVGEVGGDHLRIAEVHSFRGELDLAFDRLDQSLRRPRRPPWEDNTRHPAWISAQGPMLKPLQSDPRWQAWLTAAGLDSGRDSGAIARVAGLARR